MRARLSQHLRFCLTGIVILGAAAAALADNFKIDPVHSCVGFKVKHSDISWIFGRFDNFDGAFTVDSDPSKCAFEMKIQANSVDTNNAGRDKHLRSADFFNVPQFPTITFKSTGVKAIPDGFEVTGDFTMHGVTKQLTIPLLGGRTAKGQLGGVKTGFSGDVILKRSDFGMDKFTPMLGDDVHVAVSFQGAKQ